MKICAATLYDLDFEAVETPILAKKGGVLFLKSVVHFVYLCINVGVSIYGLHMCVGITEEQLKEEPIDTMKKYVAGYGTNWNYMFQTVFLFLALSHDLLEWVSKQETAIATKIRYWRDVIFSGLVVPYTCFVFGMFWSLYAIDRELVFPKVYDVVVPWWFNHCVHSNIMALLVVETILQPRQKPTDRKLELIFNAVVGISYAVVYYLIYFFAGRWLYNVFAVFNWWQVCLFQMMIWASSYIFYELQFPINRLIHGKELDEQTTENKPQHNGEQKNGELKNGELKNGAVTEVNEVKENGEAAKNDKNGLQNNIDFKTPSFSTKSLSLKYRSIRSQFENSSL